jgi:ATP-dependent helicase HepA
LDQLVADPELAAWVVDGEWDLVIVDEAHHLFWSEHEVSPEYELVQDIAQRCGGLLLLTATPRQLGLESHFGRLRLLAPERFHSFAEFKRDSERYAGLADLADRILEGRFEGVAEDLEAWFPGDPELVEHARTLAPDKPHETDRLIANLIDRHGTGRMVFRNQRKVLSGFPQRTVHPTPLESNQNYDDFLAQCLPLLSDSAVGQRLLAGAPAFQAQEFTGRLQDNKKMLARAWSDDPRLQWLLPFLRQNSEKKFLLICSRKSVALALQEFLAHAKDVDVAVFHEELNLLERDRQAAYFAKPEGAQVLLCSEIGSEGRNFQFANQLILFDLPLNPALLEQRIGRLDRIGQHRDIEIFVPYARGGPQEFLFRWYHEGLDAFQQHIVEGDYIYEHLKDKIFTVFDALREPELLEPFIKESKNFVLGLKEKLQKGRDRLLELHSFNQEKSVELIAAIREMEDDEDLKQFMDQVFDLYGVSVEDQEQQQTQILLPTSHMSVPSFPGLPDEGVEITYDRNTAVSREELAYISFDHPMVAGVIDMILGIERGTTSFAVWKGAPEAGIALECVFVMESPAAEAKLGLERYLPPIPVHLIIDQNRQLRPDLLTLVKETKLDRGPISKLHKQREALTQIVETLLQSAEGEAEKTASAALEHAQKTAMNGLKEEYDRLRALRQKNPSVRQEELDYIEDVLGLILDFLEDARLRLDAVRLIMMVPA